MNPFALQAIMGHSNLETTKHYIALVEADIREAQEKASPVRRLCVEHEKDQIEGRQLLSRWREYTTA